MNKPTTQEMIVKTLEEITLKNGKRAMTCYGDHTHLHIKLYVSRVFVMENLDIDDEDKKTKMMDIDDED